MLNDESAQCGRHTAQMIVVFMGRDDIVNRIKAQRFLQIVVYIIARFGRAGINQQTFSITLQENGIALSHVYKMDL